MESFREPGLDHRRLGLSGSGVLLFLNLGLCLLRHDPLAGDWGL